MTTVDRFCGELVMLFDRFLDAKDEDAGQARDAIHAAIKQDRAEALLAGAPSPEPSWKDLHDNLVAVLHGVFNGADTDVQTFMAAKCRASVGACWCGCHISEVLDTAPSPEPVDDCRKDLALLVHRLAAKCTDEALAARALDYLVRRGLTGSPLRDDPEPQPTAKVVAEAVRVGCVEFLRERAKGCDCGEVHEAPDASGLADDLEAMPLAPILKTLGVET